MRRFVPVDLTCVLFWNKANKIINPKEVEKRILRNTTNLKLVTSKCLPISKNKGFPDAKSKWAMLSTSLLFALKWMTCDVLKSCWFARDLYYKKGISSSNNVKTARLCELKNHFLEEETEKAPHFRMTFQVCLNLLGLCFLCVIVSMSSRISEEIQKGYLLTTTIRLVHLISFGTWFGMQFWVTFIAGKWDV